MRMVFFCMIIAFLPVSLGIRENGISGGAPVVNIGSSVPDSYSILMSENSKATLHGSGRGRGKTNFRGHSFVKTIIVDQNGGGQYTRVQKAVDSVAENNQEPVQILVRAGTYKEQVTIPISKQYITLQGSGADSTIITNSQTAAQAGGTQGSATFSVFAPRFMANDITFENSARPAEPGARNGQAVALLVAADMAAFYRCGIQSYQDTLFDKEGRHYFKQCNIRGSIDFIFGNGVSLYDSCNLHSDAESLGSAPTGSVTANGRNSNDDPSAFVFVDCTVDGTGSVYLGRAWGRYARVVFITSQLSSAIRSEGWNDWWDPSRDSTVYFGQYKCFGAGASETGRVKWSHELGDTEASSFSSLSFIDGESWLPAQS